MVAHLMRRFRSVSLRLRNAWQTRRLNNRLRRDRAVFDSWLGGFKNSDAQVILGANFNTAGGVRQHLHAIAKYSMHRVLLAPDDDLLLKFGVAPFNENMGVFFQTPPPPDVLAVHTHVLPWLIRWVKSNRRKDLVWVHTHHLWYFPEAGWDGLEPWQVELNNIGLEALRECDVPLCVSKSQQRFLRSEHRIETTYVPNGVNVDLCDAGDAERFRRKYKVQGEFVLWVGRHDPVKNPADFVRLAQRLSAVQFLMAGGVTEEQVNSDLKLECPPNLRLLPHLTPLDVQDGLAACRLVVVTSHREGLPTLVLECMTHGKPIVIPREDGCLDATNGGEFASVYCPGDLGDLADKVLCSLAGIGSGKDSRKWIMAEFDWRVVARQLDAIYSGESELVRRGR